MFVIPNLACHYRVCQPATAKSFDMTDWDTEVTQRIAGEIKRHRGERSGQWLADRTKELGHPISKTAIWEIESGKRKSISVPELLIIARALEVPPVLLLFPGMPDRLIEALPDWTASSISAAGWFSGGRTPKRTAPRGQEAADELDRLEQGTRLIDVSHELGSARASWQEAHIAAYGEAETASLERVKQLADWTLRVEELVDYLEGQAEKLGGEVSDGWKRGEGLTM